MGIIAGIYSNLNIDAEAIINRMINSKIHRDKSEPIICAGERYVFGMVNQHEKMLVKKNQNVVAPNGFNKKSIHAFVDGIVLEAQDHQRELQRWGEAIPNLTMSAIVSAAYKKWNLNCNNHLEGEFACAIWDEIKQQIVLIRDPFGHKPLHYYIDEECFVFSSEIKGILAAGIFPEIDLISLSHFLSLNCIPNPATLFKQIKQVPPGSLVIFSKEGLKIQQYWNPQFEVDESIALETASNQIEESIRNAVKKRMVTNPSFCFLSGGLDSSVLLSLAAESAENPVQAICVGFQEADKNELADAALMANHVGAFLHQVNATPDTFFNMLEKITFYHDAPFTDTSSYPTFYAAKLAKDLTPIILTGDGPDQILGGSGHHLFAVLHNIFSDKNRIKKKLCAMGSAMLSPLVQSPAPSLLSKTYRRFYRESLSPVHAAYDLRSYFPTIVKHFLCSERLWDIHLRHDPYYFPETWFADAGDVDDVNKYLYADVRFYVPDDLMVKVDRMCMAHGLETLSPYQDTHLYSIVKKLPGRFKVFMSPQKEIITKRILKEVAENRLPQKLLLKKKQGFGIPLQSWLLQDNGEFIRQILLDSRTLNRGLFKKKSLEVFVNVFKKNQGDYFFPSPQAIVALLTIELWHRRYLDR